MGALRRGTDWAEVFHRNSKRLLFFPAAKRKDEPYGGQVKMIDHMVNVTANTPTIMFIVFWPIVGSFFLVVAFILLMPHSINIIPANIVQIASNMFGVMSLGLIPIIVNKTTNTMKYNPTNKESQPEPAGFSVDLPISQLIFSLVLPFSYSFFYVHNIYPVCIILTWSHGCIRINLMIPCCPENSPYAQISLALSGFQGGQDWII
jgi:hypothetical protein